MKGVRVNRGRLPQLRDRLSPRDVAIVRQVTELKLMSGGQLQAVHFRQLDHATAEAAGRACRRVLGRLVREGVLARLERRIGGIRGGSAGYVYAVSPLGHRLLDGDGVRKRFREPSATFVNHTLAVAQLVVDLIDRHATKRLEILRMEAEPRCWRSFTTISGRQLIRPDLFVVLGVGQYEHHWFIEMDLGTETMLRRLTKCQQYQAYYRSGREQAKHELFPQVLWCLPNQGLAEGLRECIAHTKALTSELFMATTHQELLAVLSGGAQ